MLYDLSYASTAQVLESWELSRQKFGCVEEVGTMILLNLFDQAPETKEIFGFKADDNVEANPMLRVGLLIHGTRVVNMADSVLGMLGPDTDLLLDFLSEVGKRLQKSNVKKEHVSMFGIAIRDALAEIMDENWTDTIEDGWIEVYDELSEVIIQSLE
jgi:hemoglobin-like flavoprotein